ncbi:hypothetical protein Vafri_7228, partial [Volvox africanus]
VVKRHAPGSARPDAAFNLRLDDSASRGDGGAGDRGGGASLSDVLAKASRLSAWRNDVTRLRLLAENLLAGRRQAGPSTTAQRPFVGGDGGGGGGGSDQYAQSTLGGTFNMRGDSPETLIGQPERDAEGHRVTRGSAASDAVLSDLEGDLWRQMNDAAVLSRGAIPTATAGIRATAVGGSTARGRDLGPLAAGRDTIAAGGWDESAAPGTADLRAAGAGSAEVSSPGTIPPLRLALLKAMGITPDQVQVAGLHAGFGGVDRNPERQDANSQSRGGRGPRQPSMASGSSGREDGLRGLLRAAVGRALAGEGDQGAWDTIMQQQQDQQIAEQQGNHQGFKKEWPQQGLEDAMAGWDGGDIRGLARNGAADRSQQDLMNWIQDEYV